MKNSAVSTAHTMHQYNLDTIKLTGYTKIKKKNFKSAFGLYYISFVMSMFYELRVLFRISKKQ